MAARDDAVIFPPSLAPCSSTSLLEYSKVGVGSKNQIQFRFIRSITRLHARARPRASRASAQAQPVEGQASRRSPGRGLALGPRRIVGAHIRPLLFGHLRLSLLHEVKHAVEARSRRKSAPPAAHAKTRRVSFSSKGLTLLLQGLTLLFRRSSSLRRCLPA